jgi:hypothetical protein
MKALKTALATLALSIPGVVEATAVTGKIVSIDGHVYPACRVIVIKREDNGALEYYRIPDTGADNSILAVGLSAIATRLSVVLSYTPGVTSGCGTEPRVDFLSITAT